MSQSSVSFRISRSAEDLAETIHALSQRLVTLEQRLGDLERRNAVREDADPEQGAHLDRVQRLLQDCRSLLEGSGGRPEESPPGLDPGGLIAVSATPGTVVSCDRQEFVAQSEPTEATEAAA